MFNVALVFMCLRVYQIGHYYINLQRKAYEVFPKLSIYVNQLMVKWNMFQHLNWFSLIRHHILLCPFCLHCINETLKYMKDAHITKLNKLIYSMRRVHFMTATYNHGASQKLPSWSWLPEAELQDPGLHWMLQNRKSTQRLSFAFLLDVHTSTRPGSIREAIIPSLRKIEPYQP